MKEYVEPYRTFRCFYAVVILVFEGNEFYETQTLTESEYNYIKVDYLKCQSFRLKDFSSLNSNVK